MSHRHNIGSCHLVRMKRKHNFLLTLEKFPTRWMGCYHQFCCCCCCHKWRIPIDIRQPVSFGIALVIEFFFCEVYMLVSIMFLIMYVGICTYFWSCIEDLSTIVEHHSGDIKQRIMMKRLLVQFITLHMDLYKYSFRKEYRFLNIIIEHLAILPHFFATDKLKKGV